MSSPVGSSPRPADRSFRIALIPGDGIGPEVVEASAQALRQLLGQRVELPTLEAGWGTFQSVGSALPEQTLETLKHCDGAVFGAVQSPSEWVAGYRSPIVAMRRRLGLFANVRPLVSATLESSRQGVDILLVRENTEGLYSGRERIEPSGEVAVAERVISREASERIARFAFEAAVDRLATGRSAGRVTVAHKANVLRETDGLFRRVCLEVAREFSQIEVEEQLVDSLAYRLILEPERYDVIVAPNLYGDILADAGAALVGGLGLAPSANIGFRSDRPWVVAEPVHGSAPDIAGLGVANPVATLLATALLLESLGLSAQATDLRRAVKRVLAEGPRTPDLGGQATTQQTTSAVLECLGSHDADGLRRPVSPLL